MKKEINIIFHLRQNELNDVSFNIEGTIEEKKEYTRIIFDEPIDNGAKTVIDIYNNRVFLKRLGDIKTKMEYIENEETIVSIDTDFGYQLKMNNFTKKLKRYDNGIDIIYQTESDKEQNVEHRLSLKWFE